MTKPLAAKHTPGPWYVMFGISEDGGIDIGPVLDGVGPLATVNYNGGNSEADAALIASAPDLLRERDSLLKDRDELLAELKTICDYDAQGKTVTWWTKKDGIAEPGSLANLSHARALIARIEKGDK